VVAELFFLGQLVNVRRLVVRASVGLVVISILVFQIGLGPLVVERLAAGLEDTPLTGGTMTGRLIASSEYLNMLQDNWILGVGLLHFQSGALGSEDARLYTSELGSLEIVFRLGILGGVWLIGLVVVCLYRVRVLLRMAKARVEDRVVAIGGVSMMIGTLFASFVNGGLTLPGGIVLFVLFMGSLEGSILSVQQESLNRETT
jgi:O-antigen ligase